jgi:methionine-rich copper-binding protein CopC
MEQVPQKILLTDITGRHIRTNTIVKQNQQRVDITIMDQLEPGVYIIHVQTDKTYIAQTILRK